MVSKVPIKSNSKIEKEPINIETNPKLLQQTPINKPTQIAQNNNPLIYNQTVQPPPITLQQMNQQIYNRGVNRGNVNRGESMRVPNKAP